jgi:hypothetical protein
MTNNRKEAIQRINVILRLPRVDLAALEEEGWSDLLDDLYYAVFAKRDRTERLKRAHSDGYDGDTFHYAMTRDMIRAAQEGLRGQLLNLRRGRADGEPMMEFALAAHTVYIAWDAKQFAYNYLHRDGPTMLYSTFAHLLDRSGIRPMDFRVCSEPGCQTVYIPLRKPHKGQPLYCDSRHAKNDAAKKYRLRKQGELLLSERARNRRRYRKRVEQMFPGSRLVIKARRPPSK